MREREEERNIGEGRKEEKGRTRRGVENRERNEEPAEMEEDGAEAGRRGVSFRE